MYSLPSLSVSANYAANFAPVRKVEGFGEVKSDGAAEYLMQLPEKQFIAEVALAKQALAERGASIRNKMEIDYRDRDRKESQSRDDRRARLNALANLGSIGQGLDLGVLGLGRAADPLGEAVAREQQALNLQRATRGRMAQFTESTKAALEGLGPMPQRGSYQSAPEVQLPSFGSYTTPAVPELSDRLTKELGSMELFHKMWSQSGSKG